MVYTDAIATADLDNDELQAPPSYTELIATVISSLKDENEAAYENQEQGHTWKFKYGTVDVLVHLSGDTEDDTLTVWSPVLKLPVQNEAQLTKMLLEKNWSETLEGRFSLWNDHIVLHSSRTLAGITPGEISRTITVVASLADEYDEPLQEQFKA